MEDQSASGNDECEGVSLGLIYYKQKICFTAVPLGLQ